MEARGRSRKSTRRINARHQIRAWMSMVLTAVMIIGNMATSVNTVLAATPAPREEFQIRAKDIQKAAEKALDRGEAVSKDILISGKDENVVKEYEKLFAADGKLYELNLTKETGTVKGVDGVDLRVFMRLPEEADPKTHVLNGKEELYFVYINDGEESVSARLNIDGLISGFSTVRAYEAVFGDEEEKDGESASGGSVLGNSSGAGDASGSEDISDAENTGNGTSDESGKPGNEEAKQDSEAADENVNPGEESKEAGREEEGEAVSQDGESIEAVQNHESRAEETAAEESREEIATEASDKYHPTESAAASEEGKADAEDNEGSSKQDSSKEDNQEVNGKEENNSAEADRKEDNGEATGNQENDSKVDGSKENDIKENNNKENGSKENDNKGNSSEVSSEKESSQKDENHGQESEKAASENKDGEKSADKAEAGNKSGNEQSASDKDKSSGSEQSGADKDKSSGSEQSGSDKDKSSGSEQKTEKDSSKEEKSGAKDDKASSRNDHKEDSKSGDSKSSDSKSENSSAKEVSINSLQISLHQILRVAEPEDTSAEEIETSEISEAEEETETEEEAETEAEPETEEEPETKEESEIETEPEIEEESDSEKETEVLTETEAEIEAVTGENAETESRAEAVTEETAEMETGEEAATEETAEVEAGVEATTGETTETETVFDDEEEIWEEDELAEIEGNQTPVEETDPFKKRGVLEGKVLNLVAFEDGLTARAFVTTLEKLGMNKEDLIEGGHILTYTISPAGSAVVVNAPELVRDESEVVFGVTPQVGYRVAEVTANGEMLEKVNKENMASVSNAEKVNEDYVKEDTEYFRIPSVLESQDIEITLKEITEGTHPAFRESKTVNGVTITVSAGENILPEGTYLTVEEVTEKIEEAVKENVKAEKGTEVQTVIAYDINLMLDGKKLSNASWSGNYVNVEFSGERIEELKRNGESIEVAPLETPTQVVEAADGEVETLPLLEDVTAEDIRVNEDEVTRIQEDEGDSIDSIQVRAEHFTVWAIIGNSGWDTGNLKRVDAKVNVNVYREADAGETATTTISGNSYVRFGTGDITFPVNTSNKSSVSDLGTKTISVDDINLVLSGITSVDDKTTVHPTNVYYKNGNSTYLITDFSVTQSRSNSVIITTITGKYNNSNSIAFATLKTTISLNTDKTVSAETTTITSNNADRFYWIIDRPNVNLHKVEWYVNGKLDKVTYVADGETPTPPYFEGEPEAIRGKLTSSSLQDKTYHKFINNLNFKGWAKEPNSRNWFVEREINSEDEKNINDTHSIELFSPLSSDNSQTIKYYAIFTYDTLFYVLLPNRTETGKTEDYTYVGPEVDPKSVSEQDGGAKVFGEVIVPDNFDRRESRGDIEQLIIVGPNDESVNAGLNAYYKKENDNWNYNISWLTLTVSLSSNGYTVTNANGGVSKPVIDRNTILHVDGMVTLVQDESVDIGYDVVYPDGSSEMVTVNYKKENGSYPKINLWTESSHINTNNIAIANNSKTFPYIYTAQDGTKYRFDGWYKEKYAEKITDGEWQIIGPQIFHARYVAITGSLSVKKILEDGTNFTSSNVGDVEFQLYSTNKDWSKDSAVYKPIGDVVTMTAGTAEEDTTKRIKFGTFTFSNLAPGYYYLHEVKTTPGYKLLEEDIKIEISVQEDGTVNCYYYDKSDTKQPITNNVLEVTNKPAYTAVLPDTGGPGLGLIKEFGWVLLLLALMMAGMEVQYYGERRRKVRIDELSHEAQGFDEF